jgi:hypothetical protein
MKISSAIHNIYFQHRQSTLHNLQHSTTQYTNPRQHNQYTDPRQHNLQSSAMSYQKIERNAHATSEAILDGHLDIIENYGRNKDTTNDTTGNAMDEETPEHVSVSESYDADVDSSSQSGQWTPDASTIEPYTPSIYDLLPRDLIDLLELSDSSIGTILLDSYMEGEEREEEERQEEVEQEQRAWEEERREEERREEERREEQERSARIVESWFESRREIAREEAAGMEWMQRVGLLQRLEWFWRRPELGMYL